MKELNMKLRPSDFRPSDFRPHNVFRLLDGRPIHWQGRRPYEAEIHIHRCEGADVHPGERLLWTLCKIDVPANTAFLPRDNSFPVDCSQCLLILENGK